ncbi:dynamin family protein [Oceanimonas baumannii]|uniref:dynamin family protein n=1 Tax=Oceanimonas baumannii TaxID=129578 RepID=UPI003A957DCE
MNIDVMHQEGKRLLKQQINLLEEIRNAQGVVKDKQDEQRQTFDTESIQEHINVLESELIKLENLDMVLAVVGTMKSGKSTTNNAIVGLEVLPNRNRPMTALPTIIRHTTDTRKPRLIFENNQPINDLIERLRKKTISLDSKLQEKFSELVNHINNGYLVNSTYHGDKGIFEFLKGLNDLVRLASELKEEFPFDSYLTIEDLPVIEVEFQHLRDADAGHGRFSLLDTPGPNEEGQKALRPMLKQQLNRASAVIAVLDYTQLKSESDAEVRKELLDIADIAKGRLFVMVNKFDQKDRHGDGVEAIKELVANDLLKGKITSDNVFPVSSKFAYLANRAKTELIINGRLPSVTEADWVQDFGEEGLGRSWERKLDDLEEVNEAINHLWKDSLFDKPLKEVIQHAHSRAAIFAIDSAASKLVDSGDKINNFVGLRESALKKSALELQNNIKNLEEQKSLIESCQETTAKNIEKITDQIINGVINNTDELKRNLHASLERYFNEGRAEAKDAWLLDKVKKEELASEEYNDSLGDVLRAVGALFRNRGGRKTVKMNERQDFDPSSPIISFPDQNSAENLLSRIEKVSSHEFRKSEELMEHMLKSIKGSLKIESEKVEKEALGILKKVKFELKNDDFDLRLNLPDIRAIEFDFDVRDMVSDMISQRSEKRTGSRRKDGVWGTVCSWFNTTDWGWEDYTYTVQHYDVDIKKIKGQVLVAAKKMFENVNEIIERDIIKRIEKSNDDFFNTFSNKVEEIRGDLLEGMKDSQRSKKEQEAIVKYLEIIRKKHSDMDSDSKELKRDLDGFSTMRQTPSEVQEAFA